MVCSWQTSKPRTKRLDGRNTVVMTHSGFSLGRSSTSTGISFFKKQRSQMNMMLTGHATKHGVVEMLLCQMTLTDFGMKTGENYLQ